MYPKNIFLYRHGESEANKDKTRYKTIPDYATRLTENGHNQASNAGQQLKFLLKDEKVMFYTSPLWRTKDTLNEMVKHLDSKQIIEIREDSRLREQEWQGEFTPNGFDLEAEKDRYKFGMFYYRYPGGESIADVSDRMYSFIETLHREFQHPLYPPNAVIILHGMSMRVFIKNWFDLTVENFLKIKNPKNCEKYHLQLQNNNGEYKLLTELTLHNYKEKCLFRY